MQVAILAGGLGTRLKPLTDNQPKSLIKILGRPFLEYQLELLKKQGITDIVLCTGHLGEQIDACFGDGRRFGVNIRYSREQKLLGTAGALKNAGGILDGVFFTMYADSYLFLDFKAAMTYFLSQSKLALMGVYRNRDRYDRSNTAIDGGLVKRYSKQARTSDMVYIDYGANIFRKKTLELVPDDRPCVLEDLFPRLIDMGELLAYEVRERFYEIGSFQGLRDFEEFIKKRQLKGVYRG